MRAYRLIFNVLLALILGLLLTSQAGCLVVAAAAGTGATVAYVRGDLETSYDGTPKEVADATERAFKSMDVAVIEKSAGSVDGKVLGRSARDVKLEVTIKGEGDRVSRVTIRAGLFGDAAIQEHIANKIREQLALGAPHEPRDTGTTITGAASQPSVADTK